MTRDSRLHPTLYISDVAPFVFPDVREAIDAVSAFEATSPDFHEYDIASFNPACPLTGYVVAVKTGGEKAGWLRECPHT